MSIRLAWLFCRSRLAGWGALGLGILSVLFAMWCFIFTNIGDFPIIMTIAVPLLMATLIVGTTEGPFGETERTASQPLVPLRLGQIVGMLTLALTGLVAASSLWDGNGDWPALARNLLGIAGIGLIVSLALGTSLAWVGPAIAAFVALFAGDEDTSERTATLLWTWPVRESGDGDAIWVALLLLAVGVIAHVRQPSKNTVDDMH